jgi:DivIVA domain-containing protein
LLMDEDDPEKRIAELERQHAESRTASTARRLTPADVRNAAFSKPPWGKRGYNEEEVDVLLDRIHAKLLNPSDSSLTASDIRNAAFSKPPLGKRGYNEDEVDAMLDRVEAELRRLDGLA